MEVKDYILQQVGFVHRLVTTVTEATTEEQFNWVPPGTVNPISSTLLHLLTDEDLFVQRIIRGKPLLWEADGWQARIGVSTRPARDQGWDEVRSTRLAVAPVLAFGRAVQAATDAYLAGLSADELDRTVPFISGERPVAVVLAILVNHCASHAGEIAAIKGMQGAKGLPM